MSDYDEDEAILQPVASANTGKFESIYKSSMAKPINSKLGYSISKLRYQLVIASACRGILYTLNVSVQYKWSINRLVTF